LRKSDFNEIVDDLINSFASEIGPARDRPSSQRHERWVKAAGGLIRGFKAVIEGNQVCIDFAVVSIDLS
jgi:hypothetical protein